MRPVAGIARKVQSKKIKIHLDKNSDTVYDVMYPHAYASSTRRTGDDGNDSESPVIVFFFFVTLGK